MSASATSSSFCKTVSLIGYALGVTLAVPALRTAPANVVSLGIVRPTAAARLWSDSPIQLARFAAGWAASDAIGQR